MYLRCYHRCQTSDIKRCALRCVEFNLFVRTRGRQQFLICVLIVRLHMRPNLWDSRYTPCACILSPLGALTSALCYSKHSFATNSCTIFIRLTLTDICLQEGTLMCSFVVFHPNTLLISKSYFQCDEENL